ncbi:hypothetical protein POM88_008439 [Heracleum sosnowskyi]|uniref:Uncharacterized protein n=1 Tax=Heracleum sosnowskyi TaxID=360622 RepID=A0AAD8J9G1_9APIA|nr:hypothetical protein POM88_008439 [Heracleum sosnowskyi]
MKLRFLHVTLGDTQGSVSNQLSDLKMGKNPIPSASQDSPNVSDPYPVSSRRPLQDELDSILEQEHGKPIQLSSLLNAFETYGLTGLEKSSQLHGFKTELWVSSAWFMIAISVGIEGKCSVYLIDADEDPLNAPSASFIEHLMFFSYHGLTPFESVLVQFENFFSEIVLMDGNLIKAFEEFQCICLIDVLYDLDFRLPRFNYMENLRSSIVTGCEILFNCWIDFMFLSSIEIVEVGVKIIDMPCTLLEGLCRLASALLSIFAIVGVKTDCQSLLRIRIGIILDCALCSQNALVCKHEQLFGDTSFLDPELSDQKLLEDIFSVQLIVVEKVRKTKKGFRGAAIQSTGQVLQRS